MIVTKIVCYINYSLTYLLTKTHTGTSGCSDCSDYIVFLKCCECVSSSSLACYSRPPVVTWRTWQWRNGTMPRRPSARWKQCEQRRWNVRTTGESALPTTCSGTPTT